ncbi:MAG: hypothetical protein GKS05_08765 [Nitrospirales bacterium]|nr:hypothetical protein [Nitrospirales bacterium]
MTTNPSQPQLPPETWYTAVDSVNVTKEKSPVSEVMKTLKRGESVKVLEKGRSHYQVKVDKENIGWVAKSKLLQEKPSDRAEASSRLAQVKGTSSILPKESRTGGSIRG